jgi:predicted TIM-barrel fold metal-dependent hydrolase
MSIVVPSGAVDCHVHIVGPLSRFPQEATRHYTAAEAPLEALRQAADQVRRFVVVQPSFYGTDNEATLQACDALNGNSRAVAVVDPAKVDDAMAGQLKARGVAGLRINLNSRLKGDHRQIQGVLAQHAALAQRMGWHLQLVLPFTALLGAARMIEPLPVPVVIDHFGLPLGKTADSGEAHALRDIVGMQHVWVKLSAPYRLGLGEYNTTTPRDWTAALLEAAPDRCLWGSDWPHVPPASQQTGPESTPPNRPLSYAALLEDFILAVGNADLVRRVLVENPQRLYGFSPV